MFPLEKNKITINNTKDSFLNDYTNATEIPYLPHPGAFGVIRKNHIHEGIDLYCNSGDRVLAIEDGEIVSMGQFTGEKVGSPWWKDTWYIMVKGASGVFNYGEIIINDNLIVGQNIKEGQVLGFVKTVLKVDKGRPLTMLHLELYTKDTKEPIKSWKLDMPKPIKLLNPTEIIKSQASI